MAINVFKFGGASVKDAEGFTNVSQIIDHFKGDKLAIVVSATGKTTNALEEVVKAYFKRSAEVGQLVENIKEAHFHILKDLGCHTSEVYEDISDLFVEIDWIIEDEPQDSYDYTYDQVVAIGELISSKILHYALNKAGHNAAWLDIRGVLFTDEIHREAKVQWEMSQPKINQAINALLTKHDIVVTQGFIGSTVENHTTTLGREGSDYTAAILSYCLDAEAMHIWKDVPGVLTADPRVFDNVIKIERLTYKEAIEMTYYGAKVIHPKTIKPLQNKTIPLFVRPFNDISSTGTRIGDQGELSYPPIVVLEPDQALVHIGVRDFSFVAEHHISNIFKMLADLRIKVNMMRNTAISFSICVQYNEEKINQLEQMLTKEFTFLVEKELELITIRHYTEEVLNEMKKSKLTLFEERLTDTAQIVVKAIPLISRKNLHA